MMFPGMGGQVEATATRQLTSFRAFVNRHAVLTYFTLVFALTLTVGTLIAFLGTGGVPGAGATSSAD
jgi:hypothetical protein